MTDAECRAFLLELFNAAVAAAAPHNSITKYLPEKPGGRCLVVGAGKASAEMAVALEHAWPDVDLNGVVSTRYGHSAACRYIKVIEAGHPVPDDNSVRAANEMLSLLQTAKKTDLVLALISGGGSACLALPIDGITLEDKQVLTGQLLRSGAPISAMNTVRKALSAVKGGTLAAAAGPAAVFSLIISDVPGDDPADVASGPTVPDRNSPEAVLDILNRYGIQVPANVSQALAKSERVALGRPQDHVQIIASPAKSLDAMTSLARKCGFDVVNLGDTIEGESANVAASHAAGALELVQKTDRPTILISGGETTVTLPKDCKGSGGRNTEYQLAMAQALCGNSRIWSLAGDSDGVDGVSDAAGAIVSPDTLERANRAGISVSHALAQHSSYDVFAQLHDLVITGPTRTNVNDIRIQLIV